MNVHLSFESSHIISQYDNEIKIDWENKWHIFVSETIAGLMNKGIAPVGGGWSYLKGMAHIYKSSFTISPIEWAWKMKV